MIGRPLMIMPFARAASRAPVTGGSVVVRPIAGNIDDAPQPAIGIFFEQLHCEINRAGNRGYSNLGEPAFS